MYKVQKSTVLTVLAVGFSIALIYAIHEKKKKNCKNCVV